MKEEVNKLMSDKLTIEKNMQEKVSWETQLKELKAQNVELEKESKVSGFSQWIFSFSFYIHD
jgi:hypothetical protein